MLRGIREWRLSYGRVIRRRDLLGNYVGVGGNIESRRIILNNKGPRRAWLRRG
jgi:hypothetical protein